MSTAHESLIPSRYPQEQKLDRDTVRRWRSEAITAPAQDRLWLNRCEALCNALLDALHGRELARLDAENERRLPFPCPRCGGESWTNVAKQYPLPGTRFRCDGCGLEEGDRL